MWWRSLTVILCLASLERATAQAPAKLPTWLGFWTNCAKTCPSVGCCPDDYCAKPSPAIADISRCGGTDDYCRKPMPCLTDILRGGGCDDYCRKPLPTLLCPPCSPFLQCGPSTYLK